MRERAHRPYVSPPAARFTFSCAVACTFRSADVRCMNAVVEQQIILMSYATLDELMMSNDVCCLMIDFLRARLR